eukprot:TRINITY_DN10315_c0_g1_i1.p1 TRINITY_DN10315_c0_g1~~TRINITY_DN10315_c0_g1_i1.p1  ORF type:complete len:480 (-),score=76.38 TRINITY_DN10315_c0_g1_i1:42-1481(-)
MSLFIDRTICPFYLDGYCKFGDACKNIHDTASFYQSKVHHEYPVSSVNFNFNINAQSAEFDSIAETEVTTPVKPIVYSNPEQISSSPKRRSVASFYSSDSLRSELNNIYKEYLQADLPDRDIVENVGDYYDPSLVAKYDTQLFGQSDKILKGFSVETGVPYLIYQVTNSISLNEQCLEKWQDLKHHGLVPLYHCFSVNPLNSNFVYEYQPASMTLYEKHFEKTEAFKEDVFWDYFIQLLSTLYYAHTKNVKIGKIINLHNILVQSKNRIKILGIGIEDYLKIGTDISDFEFLRKLLLQLCHTNASIDEEQSMEYVRLNFSTSVVELFEMLGRGDITAGELMFKYHDAVFSHINNLYDQNDFLVSELLKEYDNGRLIRLLIKMGFINERPEFNNSPHWSETGDRYLVKLFRDYVFHQVTEDRNPVIDFGFVVDCLNKLDAGVNEMLLLVNRDEKAQIVVSYRDLKRIVSECFDALLEKQY